MDMWEIEKREKRTASGSRSITKKTQKDCRNQTLIGKRKKLTIFLRNWRYGAEGRERERGRDFGENLGFGGGREVGKK